MKGEVFFFFLNERVSLSFNFYFIYLAALDLSSPSEVKSFSCVQLFATPWTVAYQASSVHGILQARILEWVTISFSISSCGSQQKVTSSQRPSQVVKRLPAMLETWVQFLGREDPLEKEMATHSSILAWKIPWTEESPWGSQRVRYD